MPSDTVVPNSIKATPLERRALKLILDAALDEPSVTNNLNETEQLAARDLFDRLNQERGL